MSIKKRYKDLLSTLHRILGQSRRFGIDSDYSEVKHPTEASIKRLEKAIEMVRTKLWFRRMENKRQREAERKEIEEVFEADEIIENFMDTVLGMAEDDYQLQHDHSFRESSRRTAGGYNAKMNSAMRLVGYGSTPGGALGNAISARGKAAVAKSIQKNGEFLQQAAEDIVFAIYESKYAKWGGGRAAYEAYILMFEDILMGYND